MNLLAIDTATRSCSVGLLRQDRVVAGEDRDDGQTHSRHLLPMIDSVLSRCRMAVPALDAVAVTTGPGSFTGLRIGMATAKGLAVSADIPLVGVMTLDALALQAEDGEASLICPLVDARKKEVYGGIYRPGTDGMPRLQGRPFVGRPEQVAARIDRPCLFVGDGALLYRTVLHESAGDAARLAPDRAHRIRAATVGRIALDFLRTGQARPPSRLTPVYIRKSDAELKLGG